jgi:uncharacterized RDD family membrane protein YckC
MNTPEVRIETPEQVSISYKLAGIGTRAIAQLIDVLLLGVVYTLFGIATSTWSSRNVLGQATSYVIGIVVVISFFIFWGYFIVLEYFLSGQTLGKKLVKVRVVQVNGRPVTFFGSLIRNLLRLIDVLPTGYLIGVIVMLIDKRERRIGDLAAGTMVIVDRSWRQLPPLAEPHATDRANHENVVSMVVEVPKSRFILHIDGDLPMAWDTHLKQFERRLKGLSKSARQEWVRTYWSGVTSLSMVRVSVKEGVDQNVTVTEAEMERMLVALVRVLKKRSKRSQKA